MKKMTTVMLFFFASLIPITNTKAKIPDHFILRQAKDIWVYKDTTAASFFPYHVGDRWEYVDVSTGTFSIEEIVRDSIGQDRSHNMFCYDRSNIYPFYKIDTSLNVFRNPQSLVLNYLLYKLAADTGEVWEVSPQGGTQRFAWVVKIDSGFIFSRPTIRKIFHYNAGPPDYTTQGQYFYERWLASGFGLIYDSYIESGYSYLNGCIIAGDTFGIVTSVKPINNEIPNSFVLKQNYPNPFNPSTTIEFDLPKSVEVNVSIYDILGRRLAVLINDWKRAGNYKVQWNANRVSTGLYFCRFVADSKILTIKMLLLK